MHGTYLLFPVGLGVLLTYLLSHLLVKFEVITQKFHRRFWNTVLLITFLIAGIIGLLLAIQINYKLDWKIIDQLLSWHVNFGIAMALVGVIHLIWHFDYYLKMLRAGVPGRIEKLGPEPGVQTDISGQGFPVFLTGMSGTIIQVLLLRELTTLFQGNEIMLTWTLGIWMILTGTGSWIGGKIWLKRNPAKFIPTMLAWIVLAPSLLIILLILIKNSLFFPGVLINPLQYLLTVVVFLAPVCIFTGILFSYFVRSNSGRARYFVEVYSLEAIGSLAGGIIVSFLFIRWLSILQSLLITAILVTTSLTFFARKYSILAFAASMFFLLLFFLIFPVENKLYSRIFGNYPVVVNSESAEGNICLTENGGEYNFFLNGTLLFNTGNYTEREEFVHFAMLQHPDPHNVLLLSGGVSGMTREILKYPDIRHVDYLEINRKLLRIADSIYPLPDTSILTVSASDIHAFLRKIKTRYDIAIMAVPDPSSVQLNRYYSDALIARLKNQLNPGAVLIYGLASSGNYLSEWQNRKLSLIFRTLKKHFSHVLIIQGGKDYLLASDHGLTTNIASLYAQKSIKNIYVNDDYMDDQDLGWRSRTLTDQLRLKGNINDDNHALPVFYTSLRYLTRTNSTPVLLLPLLFLFVLIVLLPGKMKGMYVAGFSGASAELILLFMLQIALGYIYSVIGILVAVFMASLAFGAILGHKSVVNEKRYRLAFLFMILYFGMLYVFLSTDYQTFTPLIQWLSGLLLMLIPSCLSGYIFVASALLVPQEHSRSAPYLYAVDLLGSAMGILVMTLIIIPVLGLPYACLLVSGFNLVPLIMRNR